MSRALKITSKQTTLDKKSFDDFLSPTTGD